MTCKNNKSSKKANRWYLQVEITGVPQPQVKWYKGNDEINNKDYQITFDNKQTYTSNCTELFAGSSSGIFSTSNESRWNGQIQENQSDRTEKTRIY